MKHTIIRKKQEYPTGAWRTIETRATLPSGDAGMVRCSVVTFWQVPTGNYGAIAYPLRSTSRTIRGDGYAAVGYEDEKAAALLASERAFRWDAQPESAFLPYESCTD